MCWMNNKKVMGGGGGEGLNRTTQAARPPKSPGLMGFKEDIQCQVETGVETI